MNMPHSRLPTETTPGASPGPRPGLSDSERQRSSRITLAIRQASRELRQRKPFLRHQDAIGLSVFGVCVLVIAASALLYVRGLVSAWACGVAIAFALSIVHEIEHDLIHNLYFKNRPYVQHVLFLLGWILRPNTINPWIRRRLHLRHHRLSGTPKDLEERAITNGEPIGVKRLVMMADGLCAIALRVHQAPGRRLALVALAAAAYFPFGLAYFAIWYAYLCVHVGALFGWHLLGDSDVLRALDVVTVLWVVPNFIRSFCINFISSNMHYYGDIERGNLLQQTQVLNAWFLLPLQLFCFNFGSTHAIHHYVAGEPFYIRQWTARAAHLAMRENGVRFNDLGTFRRANRFHAGPWRRRSHPSTNFDNYGNYAY